MRYTFSKMSVIGALIFVIGLFFMVQGIKIRYHLANIRESYGRSEIKSGCYMECDIAKEQLIGKYYSEGNGTIKYGPYCNEDLWSQVQTYIVATNKELNYYVPLMVPMEYQKDFGEMVRSDSAYHIFGRFEKKIVYCIMIQLRNVQA